MKLLSYWMLPLISGIWWLATLLGLLLYWVVTLGKVKYPSMQGDQTFAYISDIGAFTLKPFFIVGCIMTTIFLDASFIADRWLRHSGRLAPNTSRGEKILSGIVIFWAAVGTVGLTCLSGFDTYRHPALHNIFLLVFILGYLLSAVFICWEYQRLGKKYRQHRILRISFWIKLIFIVIELALAVAFGVTMFNRQYNIAAPLEWAVAFVFAFYVFSFMIDLWPAARSGPSRTYTLEPMTTRDIPADYNQTHTHGLRNPRPTQDSERTLTNGHQQQDARTATPKRNGHTDF